MQTFVPYGSDFRANAEVLDRQRLGKQRVEGLQILRALSDYTYGWQNHPAVKMWRGYSEGLAVYTAIMCNTWLDRGYKDSVLGQLHEYLPYGEHFDLPPWIDEREVLISHRSNLVRKAPEHYRHIWPEVASDIPYVWPVT